MLFLFINNPEFDNYLGQMYPVEFEIKDTTEINFSVSYLDLLLSIVRNGQIYTSIYEKVTVSISRSLTFGSIIVAIFHRHSPLAFLSHTLYDIPGLASHMFYFEDNASRVV